MVRLGVGAAGVATAGVASGLLSRDNWPDVIAGALFAWAVSLIAWAVNLYRDKTDDLSRELRRMAELDLLHARLNHVSAHLDLPVVDLARILGEAAVMAARSDTFLGERYRRIARRRGTKKAIVAVGRSMLVIIWHLLADPDAHFNDLGADHFTRNVNTEAKKRNHIRQLEALGYTVTLEPAA